MQLTLVVLTLVFGASWAAPLPYQPSSVNRTCLYEAFNVSMSLFFANPEAIARVSSNASPPDFIFPLETTAAVPLYDAPWQACWGPSETPNMKDMAAGTRLPCYWSRNRWGLIDYKEEHACNMLLKANCYCYAVGRYIGSYCEPGLGGTNRYLQLPITSCDASVAGILADGARRVDRATVYNRNSKPTGHYIMLAVKPSQGPDDTGDFHFWRLDAGGVWSYKAGDTLVRNTYRNGTWLTNAESATARGDYTQFCGFFEVNPAAHKLRGNGYYYSNIPDRYALWQASGMTTRVTPLAAMTPSWDAAYSAYFDEPGWEDPPPEVPYNEGLVRLGWERARAGGSSSDGQRRAAGGRQRRTYSTRPFK